MSKLRQILTYVASGRDCILLWRRWPREAPNDLPRGSTGGEPAKWDVHDLRLKCRKALAQSRADRYSTIAR